MSVRLRLPLFLLIAALFLTACQTAPDIKPFSDATGQLSSSIKAAGKAASGELNTASETWTPDQRKRARDLSDKIAREWTERNKLADALNTYASSLAEIVAAGDQGEKSAKAVADSVKSLTDSLNILPAGSAAAGIAQQATQALTFAYGLYAKDRAAKDLASAMVAVQPAIDLTVQAMQRDLRDIREELAFLRKATPNSIDQTKLPNDADVGGIRTDLNAYRNRQKALAGRINSYQKPLDAARDQLANAPDDRIAAAKANLDRWSTLTASVQTEMAAIAPIIADHQTVLKPYDDLIAQRQATLDTEIAMIDVASAGLSDWAATHAKLAAAAREKRPPNVQDLIDTAEQLRSLVLAIRNKNQKASP